MDSKESKPKTLTTADLAAYMVAHAIPGEILHLDVPTPTVERAAQAAGTRPEQIVKSILFLVGDEPILTVACGTSRVDQRAVAAYFKVGRKKARLASPETVLAVSGYEVGAMPPFGHRQALNTLMDPGVLEHAEIFAGGGAENALVRVSPRDILRVTQAEIVVLQKPPDVEP